MGIQICINYFVLAIVSLRVAEAGGDLGTNSGSFRGAGLGQRVRCRLGVEVIAAGIKEQQSLEGSVAKFTDEVGHWDILYVPEVDWRRTRRTT